MIKGRLPRKGWASEHSNLLSMAGSLFGTTVVTSVLGFVYWWVAAKMADQEMVGYATASINAMQLVGTIGMLGLGSMLIGELEYGSRPNPGLVSASIYAASVFSLVVGLGTLIFFAITNGRIFAQPTFWHVIVFMIGSAFTGGLIVLDQGMVGNGQGSAQLIRNTAFAVGKLGLIVVLVLLPIMTDLGILLSWVIGLIVSLLVVTGAIRKGHLVSLRPDFVALRRVRRAALAHNAFNVASQLSRLVIPIIAATVVSPAAGAAFFMAWMIAGLAYIVPSHLSTALFAIGAGRLDVLRVKLRFSLGVSAIAGLIGVPIMVFGAELILTLFGTKYAELALRPFQLLALCYFLMIVKYHYIAVTRVEDRLFTGAAMAGAAAVLDISLAVIGAMMGGLEGLTVGFAISLVIQTLVMSRDVIRAATRDTGEPATVG